MRKLLFFILSFGFATVGNAMDHSTQVNTYLRSHEWTKLIGYMVDNSLSVDLLYELRPKNLDLGLGKHRFLIKLIAYIRSKDKSVEQKKEAISILKSLLVANKFDLNNKDGFEGDLGEQRYRFLLDLANEAKEQQIANLNMRNRTIMMAIGAAAIVAVGLYAWYKRTPDTKDVADDQEENNLDEQHEDIKEENKKIIVTQ
jgi:hypothetical protein